MIESQGTSSVITDESSRFAPVVKPEKIYPPTHHDKETFKADREIIVTNVREEINECRRLEDEGYVEFGYGLHAHAQAARDFSHDNAIYHETDVTTCSVRLQADDSALVRLQVFYCLKGSVPIDRQAILREYSELATG